MNSMTEAILLLDYRGDFYSSAHLPDASMNIELLVTRLAEFDLATTVRSFGDLDFRIDDFAGKLVLYQSSEDRHLFYKSYIEDILLGLRMQGAILIPRFELFRAHHNKCFQEIFRDVSTLDEIRSLRSWTFGVAEDFLSRHECLPREIVIKASEGASGKCVAKTSTSFGKRYLAKRFSKSTHILDALKNWIKLHIRPYYMARSNHRKKFIAQEFIPGLFGDYKVLVYGNKYFVLSRQNRKNNFRASGSGNHTHPEFVIPSILNYAEVIYKYLNTPYASLDIAIDSSSKCYLIEFQCLHFGTTTLLKAPHYFRKEGTQWLKCQGKCELERELATSIHMYLSDNNILIR